MEREDCPSNRDRWTLLAQRLNVSSEELGRRAVDCAPRSLPRSMTPPQAEAFWKSSSLASWIASSIAGSLTRNPLGCPSQRNEIDAIGGTEGGCSKGSSSSESLQRLWLTPSPFSRSLNLLSSPVSSLLAPPQTRFSRMPRLERITHGEDS